MSLTIEECKERLQEYIDKSDDECFHSTFDELMEEKLEEYNKEFVEEMNKIYEESGLCRWYA